MKALEFLKALEIEAPLTVNINEAIEELEELKSKVQKSYTIGYVQGYLARDNQEVPEDIRELLKEIE